MLSARTHRASNRGKVGRQDAPADPATKPVLAMVPAAPQIAAALEHTDAPLDTGAVCFDPAAITPLCIC